MCRVTHRALHEAACVANTCFVVLGDLGPDTPFDDLGLPADSLAFTSGRAQDVNTSEPPSRRPTRSFRWPIPTERRTRSDKSSNTHTTQWSHASETSQLWGTPYLPSGRPGLRLTRVWGRQAEAEAVTQLSSWSTYISYYYELRFIRATVKTGMGSDITLVMPRGHGSH